MNKQEEIVELKILIREVKEALALANKELK